MIKNPKTKIKKEKNAKNAVPVKTVSSKSKVTKPRVKPTVAPQKAQKIANLPQTLLIEIGTEDLPAKALPRLIQQFKQTFVRASEDKGLHFGEVKTYSTPRRLALCIHDFPAKEPDTQIVKRGPSVAAAFDAQGQPTPAVIAFAKSVNKTVKQLIVQETPKGQWLTCTLQSLGLPIQAFLPPLLTQVLEKLPLPQRMRWGEQSFTFLRPIHWITICFGKKVMQERIYGLNTQGMTQGHRFLHPALMAITNPDQYESLLEKKGFVIANAEKRQQMIAQKLQETARSKSLKPIIHNALLEEATGLVEYPVILLGRFNPSFLTLPREVLITAMEVHQRCFACENKNGQLQPYFLIVSNIKSQDSQVVIRGNERVMEARLQDAVFHYEQDKKVPLPQLCKGLSQVVFQAGLGTLSDKIRRLMHLSRWITHEMHEAKAIQVEAERASELCKADLLTNMVGEFPELQGTMGKYYALLSGESNTVATAIEEHYLPRFAQDSLPQTRCGSIVSIVDKIDTIIGLFALGKTPTGDKDPFALRRQAAGVLRICIDNHIDIDLKQILNVARENYAIPFSESNIVDKAQAFFEERLKTLFQEQQLPLSLFDAIADLGITRPVDFWQRAKATAAFLTSKEAEPLIAANKRVKNILKSAGKRYDSPLQEHLLTEPSEKQLASELIKIDNLVQPLIAKHDYQAALKQLASLQKPIDAFFENVLVMDKDEAIKQNRLCLLQLLQNQMNGVANIGAL